MLVKEYDTIVWLDCETTGFSPETDYITELAGLFLYHGEDGFFGHLINVPVDIPEKITELTGITSDMCRNGCKEEYAITSLIKIMRGKTLVVGHNLNFDLSFIFKAAERIGEVLPEFDVLDTLTVLNDRKSGRYRLCDGIEHYKLSELCQNNHRAFDDAVACKLLMYAMEKEKDNLKEYVNKFYYRPKYNPDGPTFRSHRAAYVSCDI